MHMVWISKNKQKTHYFNILKISSTIELVELNINILSQHFFIYKNDCDNAFLYRYNRHIISRSYLKNNIINQIGRF